MTYATTQHADILMDRFGYKVTGALSAAQERLPHDITERLRTSRIQAVTRRKTGPVVQSNPVLVSHGSAVLGWGTSLLENMASLIPVAVFLAGMLLIDNMQDNVRISELAAVDAALLTDDLPPAAYADPGFAQFLKHQY
jgi:hypothetical protein